MGSFVIRFLGTTSGLISALPMPWRVRMGMARTQGAIMSWVLAHVPGVYGFIIRQNVRYGMGKQQQGEMQSIWALHRIIRQLERESVALSRVAEVVQLAEVAGVTEVELPRYLGTHLLGASATEEILSEFVDY